MSINTYLDSMEDAAIRALAKAKAIENCRFHSGVTIRSGNENAERQAYKIANGIIKREGTKWMRDDLNQAIKHQLDVAADQCPHCGTD
jgi:hypothetical protein